MSYRFGALSCSVTLNCPRPLLGGEILTIKSGRPAENLGREGLPEETLIGVRGACLRVTD